MALEGTAPTGIPGQPHHLRTARASVRPSGFEAVAVSNPAEENGPPAVDQGLPSPSTDLRQILGQVHQAVAVRQEVIGDIARRLAQGEFLTPQAAERTVRAILESGVLE